jgi:hypothetical protein
VKATLERLSPAVLTSFAVLALAVLAAFGITLSVVEQGAIVALVGAGAVVLILHRTVESVTALIAAGIAAATAFGLPVTAAQQESILILAGALATAVVGKAGVRAVKAKRAAAVEPAPVAARRKKGGRLAAFIPPGLKTLMEYATGPLTAPGSFAVPAGPYQMDNNEKEGDCTIAGVAHLLQAWNRLFKGKARIPGVTTIKKVYRELTGGPDTGLVEANVLAAWKNTGLFGTKIDAYAPVKVTDPNAIKCAIAFYGGCYLGIVVGQEQEEQFERGEAWKWVAGQEEDGHCVVALGFTPEGLLCATWGEIALLPWAFLKPSLKEAWCVFGPQLKAAGTDTLGVNVPALEADLAHV